LSSMRSSHLPFKMHQVGYVRSSLLTLMHVGSIATPFGGLCRDFLSCGTKVVVKGVAADATSRLGLRYVSLFRCQLALISAPIWVTILVSRCVASRCHRPHAKSKAAGPQ